MFRLLAIVPFFVGCHLLVEYDPSTSGDAALIVDASVDTALIDASVDTGDMASGDTASVDGDATDDTVVSDGPPVPDTSLPFCATRPQAFFCDDFDGPNQPSKWDNDSHFWLIEYDKLSLSPPDAARIVLPISDPYQPNPTCRFGRFNKKHSLPDPKTNVRLEWAFRLGDKGTDPGFSKGTISQLLVLGGTMQAELCGLFLIASLEGVSYIKEQDKIDANDIPEDMESHPLGVELKSGQYYQAELVMTLWPTPRFTFRLDGKELLDEPMDARCAGETTEFETNIGFHCLGQRPIDYEIRLDDIAVSFFP